MRRILLTRNDVGRIKTIAYHEGVSGGVKVYLQADGEFFDDRHPDYYPEDHQYDDYYDPYEWGSYPCGCCTCCGCSCWMLEDSEVNGIPYDMEDDECPTDGTFCDDCNCDLYEEEDE